MPRPKEMGDPLILRRKRSNGNNRLHLPNRTAGYFSALVRLPSQKSRHIPFIIRGDGDSLHRLTRFAQATEEGGPIQILVRPISARLHAGQDLLPGPAIGVLRN